MGCSKNYIMYWGVFTVYIIARVQKKVCTNLTKFQTFFYAFFQLIFRRFSAYNVTFHNAELFLILSSPALQAPDQREPQTLPFRSSPSRAAAVRIHEAHNCAYQSDGVPPHGSSQ